MARQMSDKVSYSLLWTSMSLNAAAIASADGARAAEVVTAGSTGAGGGATTMDIV